MICFNVDIKDCKGTFQLFSLSVFIFLLENDDTIAQKGETACGPEF